jgi:F-type H+-transporting ATPase subunit gamma
VQGMANLREIKSKIKSVKNLQKITRALEVVSTVKLQKTKQQAESLKEYLVDLLAILSEVGQRIDIFQPSSQATSKQKKLVIVLTSERGLCGALNSKLLRKIYQEE